MSTKSLPCAMHVEVICPILYKPPKTWRAFGAQGITIHPRPDERHIRYQDAYDLKEVVQTELNIEGNPIPKFVDLVLAVKPAQVTLVPDAKMRLLLMRVGIPSNTNLFWRKSYKNLNLMAFGLLFFSILTPNKSMGQKPQEQTALNSIQRPMPVGSQKPRSRDCTICKIRQNGQQNSKLDSMRGMTSTCKTSPIFISIFPICSKFQSGMRLFASRFILDLKT